MSSRPQIEHFLRIHPKYFKAVASGDKTAELRYNDRDFLVGDTITIQEYDLAIEGGYTGKEQYLEITHILTHKDFPQGLQPGYVLLSFKNQTICQ